MASKGATDSTPTKESQKDVWVGYYNNRFDKMKDEGEETDLHVVSGWTDVTPDVWKRYVKSCVDLLGIKKGGEGMSMFEAGCGCLGFLEPIRELYPKLSFGGMDGSPAFAKWIESKSMYDSRAFYHGLLPNGLRVGLDKKKYDFVVCNSVFQYLTQEEAAGTVTRMLELVKPGGKVMICDVCDEATMDTEERFMKHHVPGYGEGKCHTYYAKKWWNQFQSKKVEFFHSDAEGYMRGKTRYQALLSV